MNVYFSIKITKRERKRERGYIWGEILPCRERVPNYGPKTRFSYEREREKSCDSHKAGEGHGAGHVSDSSWGQQIDRHRQEGLQQRTVTPTSRHTSPLWPTTANKMLLKWILWLIRQAGQCEWGRGMQLMSCPRPSMVHRNHTHWSVPFKGFNFPWAWRRAHRSKAETNSLGGMVFSKGQKCSVIISERCCSKIIIVRWSSQSPLIISHLILNSLPQMVSCRTHIFHSFRQSPKKTKNYYWF